MEFAVNIQLVFEMISHSFIQSLANTFDIQYYDLLASADMLGIQTALAMNMTSSILNQSINTNVTASS